MLFLFFLVCFTSQFLPPLRRWFLSACFILSANGHHSGLFVFGRLVLLTALSILAAQPRPHWPASSYLIGSDLGLPLSFSSCFHFVDQHAAPVLFFFFIPPISPRGLETLHFAVRTADFTDVCRINGAPDTPQPHQAAFYVGLKDGAVSRGPERIVLAVRVIVWKRMWVTKVKMKNLFPIVFFSSHSSTHTTFTPAVLKIRAFIDAVHPGKPYSHSDFDMFPWAFFLF